MALQTTPALIVGAGPSGLCLAILLSLYRIPYRLIEQKTERISTSNALVVQARSLEMWKALGVIDAAVAAGTRILGLQLSNTTSEIHKISFAQAKLQTPFPFMLGLPQSESERILAEHLTTLGGTVERGTQLLSLKTKSTGVEVQLQLASGDMETVNCDWLIAADGARSTIRNTLGLNFAGGEIPEQFIMMDAELSGEFEPHYFHAILSEQGPVAFAPLKDFTRIICSVTHDKGIKDFENPSLVDFKYIIKKRCSLPITIIKPIWLSHFTAHHRMIDQFDSGRVLFIGDSAHIHSPVGGQGMNTGMQDAYNLAWKLALVIKGKCKTRLLETYSQERRHVAAQVLAQTTKMTKFITLKNPHVILLRNHFLRWILRFKHVQTFILSNISELRIQYLANFISPNGAKRAPSATLLNAQKNEIELYSLFKELRFKVLIFTGKNYTADRAKTILALSQWITEQSHGLLEAIIINADTHGLQGSKVYYDPDAQAHAAYGLTKGGICVVRPDEYIALTDTKFDKKRLAAYLEQLSQ